MIIENNMETMLSLRPAQLLPWLALKFVYVEVLKCDVAV